MDARIESGSITQWFDAYRRSGHFMVIASGHGCNIRRIQRRNFLIAQLGHMHGASIETAQALVFLFDQATTAGRGPKNQRSELLFDRASREKSQSMNFVTGRELSGSHGVHFASF